jgi:hypothetical protein
MNDDMSEMSLRTVDSPPHSVAGRRARWRNVAAFAVCAIVLLAVFRLALARGQIVEEIASGGQRAQAGQVFLWTYPRRHDALFPPLIAYPSGAFFDQSAFVPHYRVAKSGIDTRIRLELLGEYYVLEPCILPEDYVYVGYAVTNEKEGSRFLAWYREHAQDKHLEWQDIPVEAGAGTAGTATLFRLNTDLANKLNALGMDGSEATALSVYIPVLIERPGHYKLPGGWVVFLDGHVSFLAYPGPFPMTQAFVEGLQHSGNKEEKQVEAGF